jgi:hypothetical protein
LTRHVTIDAIEEILSSRRLKAQVPSIRSAIFKTQNNFLNDISPLKALWCTRRSAKSYTGGIGLFEAGYDAPGSSALYIGLTKNSARGIMWKDVLKDIDRKFSLDADFNETRLEMTLPNGSVTYLTGVDADETEMEKLLGKKYRRIVIDEAASFSVDLRKLIYGILKPAIADYRGDIWLMGTSGDITQGLYFDITQGIEPGWSLHEWSAHDNPYVARQWQEELDEIERLRPLFKQTNLYKQWYLNQWVIDSNKLVYWFERTRNSYSVLPFYPKGDWQYVLGVDLGYSPDPSAFCVVAFHENDKCLYVLESEKKLSMDVTDVANRIKEFEARFSFQRVVIDGSNKQAVQEMQNRHGLALDAADKRGKADFIQIMNAEFVQQKIKVFAPKNEDLITEWAKLVWETEGDRIVFPRKEHARFANHLCDAALYAWRFWYPYLSEPVKKPQPKMLPNQWREHSERLAKEQLEENIRAQQAREQNIISEEDLFNADPFADEQDIARILVNRWRK